MAQEKSAAEQKWLGSGKDVNVHVLTRRYISFLNSFIMVQILGLTKFTAHALQCCNNAIGHLSQTTVFLATAPKVTKPNKHFVNIARSISELHPCL